MSYRRGGPPDAGWSDTRYDFDERGPRERYPPGRMPPGEDYHRTVQRRGMVDRHVEGGYTRDFDHYSEGDDYRVYPDDSRSLGHDRRSGASHRWEDPSYHWQRDEHHGPRPDFRDRDGLRRKEFYPPPHGRERSPHKRDSFYRDSPVNRKGSPHSRSGSSISSRSYSPEKKKQFSSHQPSTQHGKNKERTGIHSLNTSRDASPPGSAAVPSSKDGSVQVYDEQSDERKTSVEGGARLLEETPFDRRSEAIALKTKEIEQVYRQDCETFGMVVKMLIDKDPSLEKSVQFALRENLHEIGERCIEELKQFIADYDARNEEQPVKV